MSDGRDFQLAVAQGRAPCTECAVAIQPAEPHLAIQHRYRTQQGYSTWSIRLHPCCLPPWLRRQRQTLDSQPTALRHPARCSRCELTGS